MNESGGESEPVFQGALRFQEVGEGVFVEFVEEGLAGIGHGLFEDACSGDDTCSAVGPMAFDEVEGFGLADDFTDVDVLGGLGELEAAVPASFGFEVPLFVEAVGDFHEVIFRDGVGVGDLGDGDPILRGGAGEDEEAD